MYNGSPPVSALNGAKGVMCKTLPTIERSQPNSPTLHGGRYIVGLNPYFIRVIDTTTNQVVFYRSSQPAARACQTASSVGCPD
jgi:hypothetical protein